MKLLFLTPLFAISVAAIVGCAGGENGSSSSDTNTVASSHGISSSSVEESSSSVSVSSAPTVLPFEIGSTEFADGAQLPSQYTCDGKRFGEGYSPYLTWSDGPEGTQSYALIFIDTTLTQKTPPDLNGYHWMVWNIPTSVNALPERLANDAQPAAMAGATQYGAHFARNGYFGPCPNIGNGNENHTYTFVVYAMPTATIPANFQGNGTARVQNGVSYFEANNIGKAVLTVTSNAVATGF